MQQSKNYQQGVILVISMLILIVIMMISISGMRTATTKEKMAANLYDRNVAFQAAEHALAIAESRFTGTTPGGAAFIQNIAMLNGINGMLGESDPEPNYVSMNWDDTNSQAASGVDRIARASNSGTVSWITPRYIIKYIGSDDECKGSAPITKDAGYGNQELSCEVNLFKIVARSEGISPNSMVYLQSYYATDNF